MTRALYPGSFDPMTNGHLDLIHRSAVLFDELIIAVVVNPSKKSLFTLEERVELIGECVAGLRHVRVESFSGLLVDYAAAMQAQVIIRGLRAVSDFEYEFQMALMNRKLSPATETVFMMPHARYTYLSSSMVREVAALGGCVSGLVPDIIETALKYKIQGRPWNIDEWRSASGEGA